MNYSTCAADFSKFIQFTHDNEHAQSLLIILHHLKHKMLHAIHIQMQINLSSTLVLT